jgi:O-antigen ligase
LQFYVSTWELITNSNWWIGVGSISFPDLFFSINEKFGASDRTVFTNPHNEYLYILATKGIIGLILYVAIFFQACVMSWKNSDQVQRIALLMFVFVFLFSITTNSMMIDMEEGHFMMLILLAFLAPKALNFPKTKNL